MADSEPVTSPDQRKPMNFKAGRIGAVISIAILLAMLTAASDWFERAWLIGSAAILAAILIGDTVLRRNGLR